MLGVLNKLANDKIDLENFCRHIFHLNVLQSPLDPNII